MKLMKVLNIKSGSALGNKGSLCLSFSSKEEKKAYVKANLRTEKPKTSDGLDLLRSVVEEQSFIADLEDWAESEGYALAEQEQVHYQPIKFLSIFSSNSTKVRRLAEFMTQEEWAVKQLTSKTMTRLGLKGSPKLSKVLVSLGVPMRKVELMLGGSIKSVSSSKSISYITDDEEYILDQGNSIYYSSCQATDKRAKWSGGNSYCRVNEDLEAYGLWLWCIGDPMHKDNKGYIARAKLRLLTNDDDYVCGLYIDRPYGAHQMLMDNVQDLVDWWNNYCTKQRYGNLPIFVAASWQREDGEGADFEYRFGGISKSMYCESAQYGYQDTMTKGYGPYSFFKRLGVESGTWLKKAYLARPKQDKVYLCPLKSVDYNAQKGDFVTSTNTIQKPWRGFISDEQRAMAAKMISLLGVTTKFDFSGTHVVGNYNNKAIYIFQNSWSPAFNLMYDHSSVYTLDINNKTVNNNDLQDLGFMKAVELPYSYNKKDKTLVVTKDNKEAGYAVASDANIPIVREEVVVKRDGFDYAVLLPYIDVDGRVVIDPIISYKLKYSASSDARTDFSLFPWATSTGFPYTIKDDTLIVNRDVEGYYQMAISLDEAPYTRGLTDDFNGLGVCPKLEVTKELLDFGYAKPMSIAYYEGDTFTSKRWRQGYCFGQRAEYYNVKVVGVNWPEEGYMPPCDLSDAPLVIKTILNTSWKNVFNIEDEQYGDRVLNRLPDPYWSEEDGYENNHMEGDTDGDW